MSSALLTGLLGIALGMRHALEPDHLAAVSTLAAEQKSARAGLVLGALWGAGHSAALLLVGGSLALVELKMPAALVNGFEVLVAAMIIALGARALVKAVREGRQGQLATHRHGALQHTHLAPGDHLHVSRWTLATRPLLIGVVHGLAGSGALTALVIADLPSGAARLSYIALFAAGSMLGMALLTGAAGFPLMRLARTPRLATALLGVTGLVSVGMGSWWGVESCARLLGG